jgi:uncharacterized membrane protein
VVSCVCIGVLGLLFFAKAAWLLRIAVCLCAVLMAGLLYFKKPLQYVQFTMVLWMVTPLIRRMIDYRFGFVDQNLVLLAPLLATAVSALSIRGLVLAQIRKAAFIVCILAMLYALAVGMIVNPSLELIYGLFNWAAPLLFGLHLALQWRNYQELRAKVQQTVLAGIAFLGAYGVYQYYAPPKWDVYWWESLPYGMVAAFGRPFPHEVRVWSTLNAPAPFAGVMAALLLLAFSHRSRLIMPAAIVGYASFALSMSRTEWIGWLAGALYLAIKVKPVVLARVVAMLVLLAVCVTPLVSGGKGEERVIERLGSLQSLRSDDSIETRLAMYRHLTADLVENPFGQGLSNAVVYHGYSLDSGPLKLLHDFGVVGAVFYLTGVLIALGVLLCKSSHQDLFGLGCIAVSISAMVRLPAVSPFMNVLGFMVWLCIGLALASLHYHVHLEKEAHSGSLQTS